MVPHREGAQAPPGCETQQRHRAEAQNQGGAMSYGVSLHVWGEYACFTRPEFKAERVSYDVITPSAARGSSKPSIGSPPSGG